MSVALQNENNTASFLTTIVGGVVAAIGGLSTTELMAVIGTVLAVAGFVVNTWAVLRRDRREQRLLERALAKREAEHREAS